MYEILPMEYHLLNKVQLNGLFTFYHKSDSDSSTIFCVSLDVIVFMKLSPNFDSSSDDGIF